jgi:hypothetical protein
MKTLFNGPVRRAWMVLWAVSAVLIVVLISCVPPNGAAGTEAGNFTLFLSGGPSQAKVISDATIAELSYKLELIGPDGETVHYNAAPGTTFVTFSLAPGKWIVNAWAFKDGRPFGSGEITVTVGDVSEAFVPMKLFPVWYVDAAGNDDDPGSEEAPLATVAKALEKISADYAVGWSNNGGDTRVPARIVISGTVIETAGTNGMIEIDGGAYPPIILEGVNGGKLDAVGSNRVLYVNNADVTLGPGLTLTGGDALSGGGAYVTGNGKFTMIGGTISANNAANEGGGVYFDGAAFTMSGGTISDNHVIDNSGGGVAVIGGTFTMNGGAISDNHANDDGGGVIVGGGGFTMIDGTISSNQAVTGSGGGVYVSYGAFTMSGGNVTNNEAGGDGGGVYMDAGTLTISGGTISENNADNGGGIATDGLSATSTLASVTISDNIAATSGGGMYNNASSPKLTNVMISNNTATGYGGGIYNSGSSPELNGVTISGNTSGYGGGMYNNNNSSPVLINVTISGNKADDNGGGMLNNNSSSPVLINVTISGNIANDNGIGTGNGGGMYNDNGSSPVLINLRISGNTADYGGGVYNYGDGSLTKPALINVTIAGNTATNTGGGMCNYFSSPEIRNSIIWGNTALSGTGISNTGSWPDISHSIVEGSFTSGSWNGSAGTDGGNNLDDDPLFVTTSIPAAPTIEGDYSLQSGSPASNAGDDNAYPIDSGGTWNSTPVSATLSALPGDLPATLLEILQNDLGDNDRFIGAIDMGAYERQ